METCLTFDIDFTNYIDGCFVDEFDETFPILKNLFSRFPAIKSTWFIRLDSQIEAIFGSGDYIFRKHSDKINWLLENGHEVGWHHHAYQYRHNIWTQNLDVESVCRDLKKYGESARSAGMKVVRMGWGYLTSEMAEMLENLQFSHDSSAIPRPNYKWEQTKKDWSNTPQNPYCPSKQDYRIPGNPHFNFIEVPITTVPLQGDNDTINGVLRYINPAYRTDKFNLAIQRANGNKPVVLICHPYEIINKENSHDFLAFDPSVLCENLSRLHASTIRFLTISQVTANEM